MTWFDKLSEKSTRGLAQKISRRNWLTTLGVVLVGGSSRIPLVSERGRSELSLPVVIDAHPKHAIALGAALWDPAAVAPASGCQRYFLYFANGVPVESGSPRVRFR